MRHQIIPVVFAVLSIASNLAAADLTLKTIEKAAPKEIGDSMRGLLQAKAIQLVSGDKPALEIWLRQEVPLKAKPASPSESLATIGETTFMGIVSVVESSLHDYKDNEIPKGT